MMPCKLYYTCLPQFVYSNAIKALFIEECTKIATGEYSHSDYYSILEIRMNNLVAI